MNISKWHTFNYRGLKQAGFSVYSTPSVDLIIALRGNCLIDVFNKNSSEQIAYLDFDLSKSVMLESAFRSPLIGLPFSISFRKCFETKLLPLKDLRSNHEVGFFVNVDYRNKGKKKIWNLDEMMMAIAFEIAFENRIQNFTIKPTGETKRYYRKKFNAITCHRSRSDTIMTVHLKTARKKLQHIRIIEKDGKTLFLKVKAGPDLTVLET